MADTPFNLDRRRLEDFVKKHRKNSKDDLFFRNVVALFKNVIGNVNVAIQMETGDNFLGYCITRGDVGKAILLTLDAMAERGKPYLEFREPIEETEYGGIAEESRRVTRLFRVMDAPDNSGRRYILPTDNLVNLLEQLGYSADVKGEPLKNEARETAETVVKKVKKMDREADRRRRRKQEKKSSLDFH